MAKTPVLVIHGPNLNLLGTREPTIYGTLSLEQINTCILELGNELSLELKIMQSNHEGEISMLSIVPRACMSGLL